MTDNPPETPADVAAIEADLYSLENIAREIITFTETDPLTVWRRLCLEMESTGYNVIQETRRYGVTPHQFDQHMIDFYQKSDGFMYETMVESRRPARAEKWRQIVKFIHDHLGEKGTPERTRVLMYGDSVGSDSIYLRRLGYDVYYHDFDSYCARFASWRFAQRGLTITPFKEGAAGFDFIVCLEVAEHDPDPPALVRQLRGLLAEDGYCLFSEAFGYQQDDFPTHLRENALLAGKTPELFRAAGMHPYWRDADYKPMVFTRQKKTLPWAYRRVVLRRKMRHLVDLTGLRRILR